MTDIILECIQAVIAIFIVAYLWITVSSKKMDKQHGMPYILAGFSIVLFGLLIDITDNFDTLNKYIVIGDTPYQAFLEKVVGNLLGLTMIAIGFWKLIPSIDELAKTRSELKELNQNLESTVEKRTTALNLLNKELQKQIEERKQAAEALRRTQKMDAVGQLTGGIAHDFNNILGIILGNLELLDTRTIANEKTRARIETIEQSAQRAADLTKQLLTFSSRKPRSEKVFDINQHINNMGRMISRSVTPQIEVTYTFDENLWHTRVDSGDFEDALLNLIINARDAMSNKGHLTLETANVTLDDDYCKEHPEVTPGDYIQLVVRDSGVGIPRELQEQVFEPFYTTKEQGKGTGLGLSLVYGFVKRYGGSIKLFSEPGIGTTIRIYLPRVKEDEPAIRELQDAAKMLPGGDEVILAVDDEEGMLELVRDFLGSLGYRVLTASNGQDALKRLFEEPSISLLFSDVVMPGGINGYELAQRATAERPDLKVLLTSGYTEKIDVQEGQQRFGTNLLRKPYSQTVLADLIRKLLDE